MFKIRQLCLKFPQKGSLTQLYQQISWYTSAPTPAIPKTKDFQDVSLETNASNQTTDELVTRSSMVAAAFAALKVDNVNEDIKTPKTDERIKEAKSVEELLSLAEGSGISRRLALKIVSVLADWSTSNKVKLSSFDKDPRFMRLCRLLTRNKTKPITPPHNDDLSMVINITADDEAARLINSLNPSQMVRIIGMLASRKRRSVPLLRSVSFNISRDSKPLNIKECADLLYGTAVLNYIDDNLLEKICTDTCSQIKQNTKGSAVVGSILTSLGLIRFKDPIVLNTLSEWIVSNYKITRSQDVFALFLTLAIVNHYPENSDVLFEKVLSQLSEADTYKTTTWLDFVWSLAILNQLKVHHIETVLKEDFVQKVEDEFSITSKLKLLNIDASAQYLLPDYKGTRLSKTSKIRSAVCAQSRSKQILVKSVMDALSNLVPMETYLKTNLDTGLGFYLDGKCLIDKNGNPLPFAKQSPESVKVAVMVYDFHDMCRGKIEPTGINILFQRLLQAQGFKLLTIPYTEYNTRDKLVQRVQYLQNKLKAVVQS